MSIPQITRFRALFLVGLASILGAPATSFAASAIARDAATGAFGWSSGHRNVSSASGAAVQQCLRRGKSCRVVLSCAGGGFGAIYARRVNRQNVWGASCGAATEVAATMRARKECEIAVAIRLGAIPASARGTELDWNFVVRRLVEACPGLGNCRCGHRVGIWNDRQRS